MAVEQRFWLKVDKRGPDECWPWLARRRPKGYGQFFHKGKDRPAVRVALDLAGVIVPAGHEPDHTCCNAWCMNLKHIEVVTKRENVLRAKDRQRIVAHAADRPMVSNAKLTADQVRAIRLDGRGDKLVASMFKVSPKTVRSVKQRIVYGHIV